MIDVKTLKQYPLSFSLLEKWVEQKHTTSLALLLDKVTNEELILFLDEQGVFVCICGSRNFWPCTISTYFINQESNYERVEGGKNRTDATELTIQKSFELLEQKLKVN